MESIISWLIAAGLAGFGVYLIFIAFYSLAKYSEETVARIIDIDFRTRKGRNIYSPIVEYYGGGNKIEKKADISSNSRKKFSVGDEVTVKYNPEKPDEFAIKGKSFISNLIWGICALGLGVAMGLGLLIS